MNSKRRYFGEKKVSIIYIIAVIIVVSILTTSDNKTNIEIVTTTANEIKTLKNEKTDFNQPTEMLLDVPYINQIESYPTGCESVSAVMALQYLGIDITVDEFIDNHLKMAQTPYCDNPQGDCFGFSPWEFYIGDPYTDEGFGCFAPVIEEALLDILDKNQYEVKELYNIPVSKLCSDYIAKEIPVIFWATMYMSDNISQIYWYDVNTNEKIDWVQPMHCMLLVGYDEEYYYFNDPLTEKNQKYTKDETENAYKAMYSQAIAIVKK